MARGSGCPPVALGGELLRQRPSSDRQQEATVDTAADPPALTELPVVGPGLLPRRLPRARSNSLSATAARVMGLAVTAASGGVVRRVGARNAATVSPHAARAVHPARACAPCRWRMSRCAACSSISVSSSAWSWASPWRSCSRGWCSRGGRPPCPPSATCCASGWSTWRRPWRGRPDRLGARPVAGRPRARRAAGGRPGARPHEQYAAARRRLAAVRESTTDALGRQTQSLGGLAQRLHRPRRLGRGAAAPGAGARRHAGACDFDEQVSAVSGHNRGMRPDVVVRLPGDKYLVVDAKAPMRRLPGRTGRRHRPAPSAPAAARRTPRRCGSTSTRWPPRPTGRRSTAHRRWSCASSPATPSLAAALVSRPWPARARDGPHASSWPPRHPPGAAAHGRVHLAAGRPDGARPGGHASSVAPVRNGWALRGPHHPDGHLTAASVEAYNQMVGALESRVLVSARRMHEAGAGRKLLPRPQPVEWAPEP